MAFFDAWKPMFYENNPKCEKAVSDYLEKEKAAALKKKEASKSSK